MEWVQPVVIELSKDPDAEGACLDGSAVSGTCGMGLAPGGPEDGNCTNGMVP